MGKAAKPSKIDLNIKLDSIFKFKETTTTNWAFSNVCSLRTLCLY